MRIRNNFLISQSEKLASSIHKTVFSNQKKKKTMIKKKSKQASTAKELSSTLMQMANWLRYKKGWHPDAATRQAWLCQHALEALGKGVVMLDYNKLDGSRRIARGTLCKGISEAYDRYEYKGRGGVRKTEDGFFTFAYWDLDEEGFRSFNAARLDDYLTLNVEH